MFVCIAAEIGAQRCKPDKRSDRGAGKEPLYG